MACCVWATSPLSAQSYQPRTEAVGAGNRNYVVGATDVLSIAAYGEPSLTGRFTVETDETFTYPFIGRVRAGGHTRHERRSHQGEQCASHESSSR